MYISIIFYRRYLAGTVTVQRSAHDRLIDINITISDFKIESAIRIGANPGLVMNVGSLTTKIG